MPYTDTGDITITCLSKQPESYKLTWPDSWYPADDSPGYRVGRPTGRLQLDQAPPQTKRRGRRLPAGRFPRLRGDRPR